MQFSTWATYVSEESASSIFRVEDADSSIDTDRFIPWGKARNFAYKQTFYKQTFNS
jgi:hypothetical protein